MPVVQTLGLTALSGYRGKLQGNGLIWWSIIDVLLSKYCFLAFQTIVHNGSAF